jgi:DNA-binding transcriptional MerR regulator
MAWETRQRGGRYYTRSRREDGHVVREYIGGGPLAEITAQHDAAERQRRAARDAAERAQRTDLQEAESLLTRLDREADQWTAAALLLAGYHRHHRGAWRQRRA